MLRFRLPYPLKLPISLPPPSQEIGVDMLPRVEPVDESTSTLKALTGARLGQARSYLLGQRACGPAVEAAAAAPACGAEAQH